MRLASELFARAAEALDRRGPLSLWDPCCGSAHMLTSTALGREAGRWRLALITSSCLP
ncbi:MAG: hypothetical protein ACR2L8_08485 [Solirubrobacteraceae bacterium]